MIKQLLIAVCVLFQLLLSQTAYGHLQVIRLPDLGGVLCREIRSNSRKQMRIKRYALIYKTKDQHGDDMVASGLVAFRHGVVSNPTPLFYLHATPRKKQDVPSHGSFESNFVACNALSEHRVLIAPDYAGLGYGEGDHPYMVASITRTVALDFLKTAKNWLSKMGIQALKKTIIAGYSQGGHATLDVHKYLEESLSPPEIDVDIKYSFAMSAPVNLSKNMLNSIIVAEPSSDTSFLTSLVIANYQSYYGDVFQTSPFRPKFSATNDMALHMEKAALKRHIPKDPRELLTADFMWQLHNKPNMAFVKHLAENDVLPWLAKAPIVLTYSKADKTVPALDTLEFYRQMKDVGSPVSLIQNSKKLPHTINFLNSILYFSEYLRAKEGS